MENVVVIHYWWCNLTWTIVWFTGGVLVGIIIELLRRRK